MFLLEEMLWMKWRESRPHSHTQQGADRYAGTVTITHRSSTALLPQLWLAAVSWLDLSPLTYSISQGCCGHIGRLVVWLPAPSMLDEGTFYLFFLNDTHKWWHRCMCAQKHGCIQVLFGRVWPTFGMISAVGLQSSVPCVFFTADVTTKHVSASVNHWWQQLSRQVRSHTVLTALSVQHTWDVKMLPHWATAACFAWCTEKSQVFACWEETCIWTSYHSCDLTGGSSSHKRHNQLWKKNKKNY